MTELNPIIMSSRKFATGIGLFFLIFLATLIIAPLIGPTSIDLGKALSGGINATDNVDANILFLARLPRILLGAVTGAALSVTGAVFQALLRNDLAAPFTLGVSSGASLGAVIAIAFNLNFVFFGISTLSIAAFAGALGNHVSGIRPGENPARGFSDFHSSAGRSHRQFLFRIDGHVHPLYVGLHAVVSDRPLADGRTGHHRLPDRVVHLPFCDYRYWGSDLHITRHEPDQCWGTVRHEPRSRRGANPENRLHPGLTDHRHCGCHQRSHRICRVDRSAHCASHGGAGLTITDPRFHVLRRQLPDPVRYRRTHLDRPSGNSSGSDHCHAGRSIFCLAVKTATQAGKGMSARTLMIQGTGSGVGKSIITAALCRAFYREGYKVAPFKAQNMSLNSYVTEEGGEMGRAQVFQAEACGITPHVTMNPILLKPNADNNSQVVVMGKAVDQRNAKDFYANRPNYVKEVKQAFDTLKNKYELIIMEGAGSPAEINLRQYDMVNMAMAEMADAPVLIVSDIDRGGVFAWMKGTLDLLSQSEQERVRGFIINQFRGDIDLLKPGVTQFEEMTGKPVLGVIPFDAGLFVDEEDAIPHHSSPFVSSGRSVIDVAIVQLPHIANFTDFSPLVADPNVAVRYVRSPVQAGRPDLLILPGTKNTINDLQFVKEMGWNQYFLSFHEGDGLILGICGGFQMLGTQLSDPTQVESSIQEIKGLGFIQASTIMEQEKVTRRKIRSTLPSTIFQQGLEVDGYEIHSGRTRYGKEYTLLFQSSNGDCSHSLGLCNEEGNIIGTYLHGFLDNDPIREGFLKYVRNRKNLPQPEAVFNYQEFRSRQLDRLTDLVTRSIDMSEVKRIIGLN